LPSSNEEAAMRRWVICSLAFALLLVSPAAAGDAKEDWFNAAKKGDAEAIKALLAKGADVNARGPYGVTALALAADKGHLEVVKVLLEHKADVNAKDTFYQATPLSWAISHGHAAIIKALVQAGASGAENALVSAASSGEVAVLKAILEAGKVKEQGLTRALAATPADQTAVAELLKKAGAKPPAATSAAALDRQTLAAYAGTYRSEAGGELKIVAEGGKLFAGFTDTQRLALLAVDKSTFQIPSIAGAALEFRREADKVSGISLKFGKSEQLYKRAQAVAAANLPPAPAQDVAVVAAAQNWPQFRGPHASGIADGQHPPVSWDAAKGVNVRWKTPIAGLGNSCPVVWGDRVFVTTAVGGGKSGLRPGLYGDVESVEDNSVHSWRVLCLDKRTGKVLWEQTAHKGVPRVKRHPKSTHANATPAADETHLVVCFGTEGLYCYDHGGTLLWRRDLGTLDSGWFYDADYQWGFGSSPVRFRNLAIVQCDVGKGSFLAAYDLADGKEVWRTPREEVPSWGTPTVVEGPAGVELVTNATKFARGYDPRTGKELWRLARHSEITVPTPVLGRGLIFVTSGYRPIQPIYAIRPGARGDISLKEGKTENACIAWSTQKGGPYMPTPIVYGDYLYCCSNAGILTCCDARTGKQVYKERLGGRGGYTASPVAADGRLYFTSEEGAVRVVRAGPKFELLAVNPLGDVCLATPAISDGMLFVRTEHYLLGLGRAPAPGLPAQSGE
jgi:outer membrane protein assembly factor BamB